MESGDIVSKVGLVVEKLTYVLIFHNSTLSKARLTDIIRT